MSRAVRTAGLIALLALAVAPTTARASCGDWLAHPEKPAASQPSSSDVADADQDSDQPRPCTSPNCQRSPAGPIPAPGRPGSEPTLQEACWLKPKPTLPTLPEHEWLTAQRFSLLDGHALRVDRPPQS